MRALDRIHGIDGVDQQIGHTDEGGVGRRSRGAQYGVKRTQSGDGWWRLEASQGGGEAVQRRCKRGTLRSSKRVEASAACTTCSADRCGDKASA
jgi:predicted transcriptional regulator